MTDILKLSVFNTLQSYESKPLTLESILWWISHDKSVAQKTELYRNMALAISPEEAKKKVKEAMMPANPTATLTGRVFRSACSNKTAGGSDPARPSTANVARQQ